MRIWALAVGLAMLAAGCTPAPEVTGRALYTDYCAGCHGADGRGTGPAAAGLRRHPADLTGISARNGGVFPRMQVMSMIDGFSRAKRHGGVMPVFDPIFEGPLVPFDSGDGIATPTPEGLIALAAYIETLQRPAP